MKKLKKRDKYLLFAMFNIMWFALVVLYVNLRGHEVSDSLVVAWFAAWTFELACVAGITVKRNGTLEDKEEEE